MLKNFVRVSCSFLGLKKGRMKPFFGLIISITFAINSLGFAGDGEAQKGSPEQPGLTLVECLILTMHHDPNIFIQRETTKIVEGNLDIQSSAFDVSLSAGVSSSENKSPFTEAEQGATNLSSVDSSVDSWSVGASRLFRSGLVVNPSAQMVREDVDLPGRTVLNTSALALDVIYPLLRGKGRQVTTSGEVAARLDLDANRLEFEQFVALRIFNTSLNYWGYLAAAEALEISRESEARAKKIMDDTRMLIDRDEVPPNEILQLEANYADKKSSRIANEQNLLEARHTLGNAIGLPIADIHKLPLPADSFPSFTEHALPEENKLSLLLAKSMENRMDYRASLIREQSSMVQYEAARNQLKPRLDLRVNLTGNGLKEDSNFGAVFSGFGQNVPGLSGSVSLSYQWPLKNRSAKALVVQAGAAYEQTRLSSKDLRRTIGSEVTLAMERVRRRAFELRESQKAIEMYQLAIDNEKKKFLLGVSTLVDVISYEDRLLSVLNRHISRELQYANALIQLRFETGTLYLSEDELKTLKLSQLNQIPY